MIGTLVLQAFAISLPRAASPRDVKARIDRVGSGLRPITIAQARRTMRWLMRLRIGTCLSRSLCIGARLPGAEVVIGVRRDRVSFAAHAWVEVCGAPLMPAESVEGFREIARFT